MQQTPKKMCEEKHHRGQNVVGGMSNDGNQEEERRRAHQMNELIISESVTMSADDRHRVVLEVHGFHPPIREPNEDDLDSLIDRIRKQASVVRNRKAYNKALFLNPSYADSKNLLLMFLRSENFHPSRAAQRLVFHFEKKLELFGIDKLARKITYEDLRDDDRIALATGALRFLPMKDKAGRAIVYESFDFLEYKSVQNQLRANWYLLMSMIEDEVLVQREGTVRVMYNLDYSKPALHLELIQKSSIFPKALPVKVMGLHFCYNNEKLLPMLTAVQLAVGMEGRSRLRDHFGTANHVNGTLEAYNIPAYSLTAKTDRAISRNSMEQYLDRIKQKEEQERAKDSSEIVQPLSSDVILGRGRHQQEYPGNLRLAQLVDSKRQEYSLVRKLDKSRIIRHIVETFQASGGRFLERHETSGKITWRESNYDARREKVSQLFRTQTKRNSEFFGSS